jgi:RNA polymerase sigma-B factor
LLTAQHRSGDIGMATAGLTRSAARSRRNRDLLVAYHLQGDRHARAAVIEENLPLVRSLAARFAGRGEQVDDLVQVGSIGLIKSVDRFHVGQGDLASYAVPLIVGEIRRHLRDRGGLVRRPRDGSRRPRLDVLPLDADGPYASDDSADELERGEQRVLLEPCLSSLDERERLVLALRFYADLSQTRIAAETGLSQGHVSRVLERSISRLRRRLGASS